MNATPPTLLSEDDYEAIEAAVMETARGRWFLSQYAQRNRASDTRTVLDAIGKLENLVQTTQAAPREQVRHELMDMSSAIERTRQEIARLAADTEASGRFVAGSEALDTIVGATHASTQEIVEAAGKVQALAWEFQEAGVDPGLCATLDRHATEIYLACSFQSQTGERIAKVIQTLRHLDGRINAMLDMLGQPVMVRSDTAPAPMAAKPASPLIEARFEPAPSPRTPPGPAPESIVDEDLFDPAPPAAPESIVLARTPPPMVEPAAPPRPREPIEVRPAAITAMPAVTPTVPPLASRRPVPLLPDLAELSFAEKMALFS